MKKYSFIIAAAAAVLALASCNKETPQSVVLGPDEGNITISVTGEPATKATASAAEKKLNSLTFLVFDHSGGTADGNLDIVKQATAAELETWNATNSGSWVIQKVKTGLKTVVAVGNLAYDHIASIMTLADLRAIAIKLEDNARDSFVMYKEVEANVIAGSDPQPSITLDRFVARVTLDGFTNNLPAVYGACTLKSIVLANVVGNTNPSNTAAVSTWYNKLCCNGTPAPATVIGNGTVAAEVPTMTFETIGTSCPQGGEGLAPGKSVYGLLNSSETEPNLLASGWNTGGTYSVLYVIVTISGSDYWYPVPLKQKLEPNTDYSVRLTIVGLGQRPDDPGFGKPVSKEDATATVTVSDWTTGAEYTETI